MSAVTDVLPENLSGLPSGHYSIRRVVVLYAGKYLQHVYDNSLTKENKKINYIIISNSCDLNALGILCAQHEDDLLKNTFKRWFRYEAGFQFTLGTTRKKGDCQIR
jgi:hypothetical protein